MTARSSPEIVTLEGLLMQAMRACPSDEGIWSIKGKICSLPAPTAIMHPSRVGYFFSKSERGDLGGMRLS